MLNELHIDNFAIIENISLPFKSGLNIITGETGAGKSIILGALSLLIGERASSAMIRTGSKSATIKISVSLFIIVPPLGSIRFEVVAS